MTNVNIPNFAGQIPNFPKDAVVETNAVFSRDHIAPVYAGECPQEIAKLTMPHIRAHEMILDAALNCDFEEPTCIYDAILLVRGQHKLRGRGEAA